MLPLQKNRDHWLAQGINQYIGFYNREFYCLDNFSSFKILYKDVLYSSVEEAYQAQKFIETAPEIALMIRNSGSAHEAKIIAHNYPESVYEDWDQVKVQVMEELLMAKVSQHSYVKKKLLETGFHTIVEDSPTDHFWGIGLDRNGQNMLGKLWMKIRAELQMQMEDENITEEGVIRNWNRIKEQIKESCQLSEVSYNTWIRPLKMLQINDERIIISVPEETIGMKYIEKHYLDAIKKAIFTFAGREYDVQLVTESEQNWTKYLGIVNV